jgi:hypothetical protein
VDRAGFLLQKGTRHAQSKVTQAKFLPPLGIARIRAQERFSQTRSRQSGARLGKPRPNLRRARLGHLLNKLRNGACLTDCKGHNLAATGPTTFAAGNRAPGFLRLLFSNLGHETGQTLKHRQQVLEPAYPFGDGNIQLNRLAPDGESNPRRHCGPALHRETADCQAQAQLPIRCRL